MATQTQMEKQVVHGSTQKTALKNESNGAAKVTIKLHWTRNSVRRGRKRYTYIRPRLDIPTDLLERLGIKPLEGVVFDVEVVERDDGKVLVLKPRVAEA